jgi:hypothetical protein
MIAIRDLDAQDKPAGVVRSCALAAVLGFARE